MNARIRRVGGKENTKCHRKEASAGRDSVPLFSWCVGRWFSGRLVPSCYLCVFGSFWGGKKIGVTLRRAGTHGKGRRKDKEAIFPSSLPRSSRLSTSPVQR